MGSWWGLPVFPPTLLLRLHKRWIKGGVMETLVLTFHVLLATVLIVAILLQAGKGADIGAVFGGGGSQTLFGSRGPATFLNKLTIVMAVLFLVTSLSLAQFAKQKSNASV